tara:strand:- start:829 stop:1080 length:252 start_codon:yes stop_codon:yes gene_type:complete
MLNEWFKQQVDQLKKNKNWSNEKVACYFGFSRMTLHRYISGERKIDFDLLWEICEKISIHNNQETQLIFMEGCLHVMNNKLLQ